MKKLFLVVLGIGIFGSVVFGSGPASALTPNDFPNYLRSTLSNYDSYCSSIPEKAAFNGWISPSGSPTEVSVTVPYGTTSVPIQWNNSIMLCRDRMQSISGATYPGLPQDGIPNGTSTPAGRYFALTRNRTKVLEVNATNGTISGAVPAEGILNRDGGSRYWFINPLQYTYNASAPLISSQTININMRTATVNIFNYSDPICVAVGSPTSGITETNYGDPGRCNPTWNTLTLTINVLPPPTAVVQGYVVQDSCNGPSVDTGATVSAGGASAVPGGSPFFLSANSGNATMAITGVNSGYQVVGYCWESGGLTGGNSFSRTLNSGQTYNMRWVVRTTPASIEGIAYIMGGNNPHNGLNLSVNSAGCTGSCSYTSTTNGSLTGYFGFINNMRSGVPAAADARMTVNGGVPAGFEVAGSTICLRGGGPCDLSAASIYPGSFRPLYGLQPGATYDMRWFLRAIAPTCGGYTTNPAELDVQTTNFEVTARANFGSPQAAAHAFNTPTANYRIYLRTPSATAIGVPAGGVPNNTGGVSATLSGSVITFRYTFAGPVSNPGVYTLYYNMDNLNAGVAGIGGVAGGNCSAPTSLVYKPIFGVRNGDIQLGAGFENSSGTCTVNATAGISSWYNETANPHGSYNNYGALALNVIHSFGTNNFASVINKQSTGLTFANTGDAAFSGQTYGGKFGGYQSCVKDYYSTKPTTAPGANLSVSGVTTAMDGSYQISGATSRNIQGGTVGRGKHVVIYVEGNAHISGNIVFEQVSYATAAEIPSLYIIASGDITVAPNVSTIQGVFVAQGGADVATGNRAGTFYSCANYLPTFGDDPLGTAINATQKPIKDYARCDDSTLVVRGSVIAKRFSLTRSYGTLSQVDRAAEIIRYSPLTWISPSPLNQYGGAGATPASGGASLRYDSITSLAPVL